MIVCLSDGFDLAEQQAPGHAARVASLACDIAQTLGLDAEVQRVVLHAGLLHDAGVSVRIAGGHTVGGAWVAELFGLDEATQGAIRASHERWDGAGRPLGLEVPRFRGPRSACRRRTESAKPPSTLAIRCAPVRRSCALPLTR